jgi:hypothetical protein
VINLPVEISLASVDAEQLDNVIRISAASAQGYRLTTAMLILNRTRR